MTDALNKKSKTRAKVTGDITTIRITNFATATENKPISIAINAKGERMFGFPVGWQYVKGREDKAELIWAQKVGTGADMEWVINYTPEEYSRGDIKGATGMTFAQFNERAGKIRGEKTEEPTRPGEIKVIRTKAEYDALPSGAQYKDANGTIGIKP